MYGACVINVDEYADISTRWIALFCRENEIVCFDTFGVPDVTEEIKKFIRNKNVKGDIFSIQSENSIMCGCFCIRFIYFMLAREILTVFTSFFLPYDFEKKQQYNFE